MNSQIYGFKSQSHGWQHVLTVISAAGARSMAALTPVDGLEVQADTGHLTRFLEKRAGAIDAFVATHNIIVLDREQWQKTKRRLGERIYD